MKIWEKDPPRSFRAGDTEIRDCGRIGLEPDEQVTFVTPAGKEHDFAAKSWGFYATPSVNGRLKDQGFKTALVRNEAGRYYVMVVDPERMAEFDKYLDRDGQEVVEWLDERE